MGGTLALEQTRIAPLGWALIALRLLLMFALLLICAPLYYLWKLLGLGRFWPRVFLGGVGVIAGLDITIRGRPAKHALLLSNHVSWLDIPAIAWATGAWRPWSWTRIGPLCAAASTASSWTRPAATWA